MWRKNKKTTGKSICRESKDFSQIIHESTKIILKLILEWAWKMWNVRNGSEDKCECAPRRTCAAHKSPPKSKKRKKKKMLTSQDKSQTNSVVRRERIHRFSYRFREATRDNSSCTQKSRHERTSVIRALLTMPLITAVSGGRTPTVYTMSLIIIMIIDLFVLFISFLLFVFFFFFNSFFIT